MGRAVYRLELSGQRFGILSVLSFSHKNSRGEIYWNVKCDCGTEKSVAGGALRKGVTKSCGCLRIKKATTHGMTKTRVFKSWDSMRQRCGNQNSPDYHNYGGRGINVCNRWINSFENFYQDMGDRPQGKSLDRIKNNKDYSPDNCKWSDTSQQQRNKRNTRKVIYQGTEMNIYELSELCGIKPKIIGDRLYAGWDVERIVSTPSRKDKILTI